MLVLMARTLLAAALLLPASLHPLRIKEINLIVQLIVLQQIWLPLPLKVERERGGGGGGGGEN